MHRRIALKRNSNIYVKTDPTLFTLITVQQDATVFSLLHFCRQLYMFRLLTPIIRSWYSCNYSFWDWSIESTDIRYLC